MATSTSSVAANNIYSSIAAKNKGLGGLMSGLDTESLVEALTQSTRSKIAKQQQEKTLLQWKQTAYRSTISAMTAFQKTYFDVTSAGGNMKSASYYDVYKGTSTSDSIKVNPSSSATPGTFDIDAVLSLASSEKFTTRAFDEYILEGLVFDPTESFVGKTLTLRLNDGSSGTRTIKLDTLSDPYPPGDTFELRLQGLIDTAFGKMQDGVTSIVEVDITSVGTNYQLELKSNVTKIEVMYKCEALGFDKAGMTNRIDTGKTLEELFDGVIGPGKIQGAGALGDELIFKVNGEEIIVKTTDKLSSVISKIKLSGANVELSYDSVSQKFILANKASGAGNTLEIEDVQGNLMNILFGVQSGTKLTSKNFDAKLGYDQVISGGALTDSSGTPSPPSTSSTITYGTGYQFVQNLLADDGYITVTINGVATSVKIQGDSAKHLLNVEAKLDAFILDRLGAGNTVDDIATQADLDDYLELLDKLYWEFLGQTMLDGIQDEFGENFDVEFIIESDGTMGFRSHDETLRFELSTTGSPPMSGTDIDLFRLFEFDGGNMAVTNVKNYGPGQGTVVSSVLDPTHTYPITFQISYGSSGLQTISLNATDTFQDLMDKINGLKVGLVQVFPDDLISVVDGRLVIDGKGNAITVQDLSTPGFVKELWGVDSFTTTPATPTYNHTPGTNAEIVYQGQKIPSTTNTFRINGVDFTVSELYNEDWDGSAKWDPTDPAFAPTNPFITINVTTDHSGLAAKLQAFVADYNTLVKAITTMIYEEKSDGYEPLTEEQKAELTDEQIERWEEEAKKGILRGDQTLRRIINSMRQAFYTTVEACGLAPYQIGLTTISIYEEDAGVDYAKSGLIKLDEEALLAALEANSGAVTTMFTDPEKGLAVTMDNIINAAVRTGSTNRGTLVSIAGTTTLTGDNTSFISEKIDRIDSYIARLKTRLENEYNRYWKKFTALESAISRMSAQTSWLNEQFS